MFSKYILSIDQGTTRTKSLVMDENGRILDISRYDVPRIFPRRGWVEQDPDTIWKSAIVSAKNTIKNLKLLPEQISCIGIADQGETIILWDRISGKPVYNAIVWQCRRTESMIKRLKREYPDLENIIRKKTGLMLDPYFSASKIRWVLEHNNKAKRMLKEGRLLVGTTDTWLIWNLTKGKYHITDYSTASRTMLFNINALRWDEDLLEVFNIPPEILPEVVPNSGIVAYTSPDVMGKELPISGVIVDQQGALFGHMCFEKGSMKATYGTGVFVLTNIGDEFKLSKYGLLTTIAWVLNKKVNYAFDGGAYYAGALIQWLIENLKILSKPEDSDAIAKSVDNSSGVYFIPAFVGLAAPYWDSEARAAILNINPSTDYRHIVRAALEGISYTVYDIIDSMYKSLGIYPKEVKVDGGMSQNEFLMQFQANILGIPVIIPQIAEITGFGVGLLAGLGCDLWHSLKDIKQLYRIGKKFNPKIREIERKRLINGWKQAIKKILSTK